METIKTRNELKDRWKGVKVFKKECDRLLRIFDKNFIAYSTVSIPSVPPPAPGSQ